MYITMNLELADRFIPSYCSISIIKWKDGVMVDDLSYLINPETPIEGYLSKRHGIYRNHVYDKKSLKDVWHKVYDMIEDQVVVIDNANSFLKSFKKRCIIDGLNLPNFKYICLRSLFNNSYKAKRDFKTNIPEIKDFLGITTVNYNSYNDALAMKDIIDFALSYTNTSNLEELFKNNKFVIGEVLDNNILDKKTINKKYKKGGFFDG